MASASVVVGLISTCLLAAGLLHRYGQPRRHHVFVTGSVFLSWYFSLLILVFMPLDLSTTAFRQCLSYNGNLTVSPFDRNTTLPATASHLSTPSYNHSMPSQNRAANASLVHNSAVSHFGTTVATFALANSTSHVTLSAVTKVTSTALSANTSSTVPLHTAETPPKDDICIQPWSHVSDEALPVFWRIVYWGSQILTWIILPLMQSYSTAGDFSPSGKLKTALYENVIYYGTYLCIFVALLIYLIVHGVLLDWGKLKVLLITASNTWGLCLLVLLLGSGLVELPRTLWNLSRKGYTLRYLCFRAAKLSLEKCDIEDKLDEAIEELRQVSSCVTTGSPLRQYVDIILSRIPQDRLEDIRQSRTSTSGASVSEKSLIRLHKQVIKSLQGVTRTQVQWEQLLADIVLWEDISRNEGNSERRFKSVQGYRPRGQLTKLLCSPRIEWYWWCVVRPILLRVFAVVFAAFSMLLIAAEVTFFIRHPLVSPMGLIHRALEKSQSYFGLELFCAATLGYMCLCTYFTTFKIRIYNIYYLVPHQQTSEYSLIFSGMMLCRLTPPLCLNFLGMTHLDQHISRESIRVETAYNKIMGHMDVIAIISDGFNVYFPMLICVLGIATYFKWGSKILHTLGFEQFLADDDITEDLVNEGRDLAWREIKRWRRQAEGEIPRKRRVIGGETNESSALPSAESPQRTGGLLLSGNVSTETPRAELLPDLFDARSGYNTRETISPFGAQWTANRGGAVRSQQNLAENRPPRNLFDDV